MKKIYKVIIIIETILLLFFLIGYFIFESKNVDKNIDYDSQGCGVIPTVVIGDLNIPNNDNSENIINKNVNIP